MRVVTTIKVEHEIPDGTEEGNFPLAAWDWATKNITETKEWMIISTVADELGEIQPVNGSGSGIVAPTTS
jgi:hypothetical protein